MKTKSIIKYRTGEKIRRGKVLHYPNLKAEQNKTFCSILHNSKDQPAN